MAPIPGDEVVLAGSEAALLFRKELSQSDIQKIYIPEPSAFRLPNYDSPIELVFYDPDRIGWKMTLVETSRNRWHLTGGWSKFAGQWNLCKGQKISFSEHACSTGPKFLAITPHPQPFPFKFYV